MIVKTDCETDGSFAALILTKCLALILILNIIQIISSVDKFWAECRLDQRQGQVSCDWRRDGHVTTITNSDWLQVPTANIAPVSLAPLQPGQRICVARSGYIAQRPPADLNLKKGDAKNPVNSKCTRLTFSQKYSEDKQEGVNINIDFRRRDK